MEKKKCECVEKLEDCIQKNDAVLVLEALEKLSNCMCKKPKKCLLSVAYEIIVESNNPALIKRLKECIGFDPEIYEELKSGVT